MLIALTPGLIFGWSFFALLLLGGGSLLLATLRNVRLLYRARSWPTTTGIVRQAELSEREDADGNTYRFRLEYVYVVDGETLIGREVFPGSDREWNGSMPRMADRYPQDGRVIVHYDPTHPDRAYLNIHPWNESNTGRLGISIICTLAGTFGIAVLLSHTP
ncbi:DUF3592 domain-containing protein [Luteolibacter sp. LG18]|uniref:DUF3592 domain-containing protein n=1 Tax=Luteolibacter sp. LG18 TaxID=2819286 RepID=UPI002B292F2A|nr:hypothetical protein llg_24660 [Luteolibacter sp. LG18]